MNTEGLIAEFVATFSDGSTDNDFGFLLDDLSAVGVMDITRQGRGYRSDHMEWSEEQRAALKAGSARGGR